MAMRLDPLYPAMVLHFLAQANFSLRKIRDRRPAARRPHRTQSRHRRQPYAIGILLRPSGPRGDRAAAGVELLAVNSDFSLMQRARVLPYKDALDFHRIAEGLAKAGLP